MPSALRRLARLVRRSPLDVVYHERYDTTVPGVPLDPDRASRILAFLVDGRFVRRRAVHRPEPADVRDILRVHKSAYLHALEDPATVSAIVGVPLTAEEAASVLELQRLAAGGTMLATRLTLGTRRPAVHLGGGFHHAGPERGAGFCAYNDVAIAVRHLRAKGYRHPVLVLDLDLHHGNGTRAAFADDPTVHTFSIHNTDWDEGPAVATTDIALGTGVDDATYLDALQHSLPGVVERQRPGLVIYVAGTDPAQDDALGDWKLSDGAIQARDRFVVETVRRCGGPRIPLVVVLSGGYGVGTWRHSARFVAWLAGGRIVEPPDDMVLALRRFRRAFAHLDDANAGADSGEWRITDDDLLGFDRTIPRETRLVGRFSAHGLETLLETAGVLPRLRALGFAAPVVDLDLGQGLGQTVRVFGEPERSNLLVEMRLKRDRILVPGFEVLFCEWLLLQNPRARFGENLPALPGQQHPGLGLLGTVVALLVLICEQVGLDGVANVPSHYHLAAVGKQHLKFTAPAAQARFEALSELLGGLPLSEAERALAEGRVVDLAGNAVRWEPAPMAIPVSERLRRALTSASYDAERRAARERLHLSLRTY